MSNQETKATEPESRHLFTTNFEKFNSFNQNPSQSSIANDSKMDSTFKSQTQPSAFSHERHDSGFSIPESQNEKSGEPSQQQISTSFKSTNQFLEAVPERSIEHSVTTNKPSFMDQDISKNRYDHSQNNSRNYKSGPVSTEFLLEKYDGTKNPYRGYGHNSSGGPFFDSKQSESQRNFYSPRFQLEMPEPKRTKSRDAGAPKEPSLFRDSKEFARFQRSSEPDVVAKLPAQHRVGEDNLFSLSKNSYYGGSVVTSLNLSDRKRDMKSTKYASTQQTYSEFDTEGTAAEKKLNWEFPNYSQISTTKPSELDYATYERTRLDTLESKLDKKEKQFYDMQEAYQNAHSLHISTRDELIKVKVEKDSLFNSYMHKKNEVDEMRIRMHQLQEKETRLQQQVKDLKHSEKSIRNQCEELENENHRLVKEQSLITQKYEAKIEAMTLRLIKLENEKSIGVKEEKLARKKSFEEEQEKIVLKSTINGLHAKNDELNQKIHYLKKINEENEIIYTKKLDEVLNDCKGTIEEKMVEIQKQITLQNQSKLKKYKNKIALLREENNNLRLELESRPTVRKVKENEAKIKFLEDQLVEARKASKEGQVSAGRRNSDVAVSKRIFKDIFEELSIDNVNQITNRFREINYLHHENSKFIKKLANLVYQCSPPGQFKAIPNLKEIWRWLKNLMEEYMSIKRNYDVDTNREYVKLMMEYLGADRTDELLNRIRHLVNEHAAMARILKYVRVLNNLDPNLLLLDIEKRLENEVNSSNDPHQKLRFDLNSQPNIQIRMTETTKTLHDSASKENVFTPVRKAEQLRKDLQYWETKILENSRLNNYDNNEIEQQFHSTIQNDGQNNRKPSIKGLSLKLDSKIGVPNSPMPQSSNDITYKILNEMLNTQSGDRTKVTAKGNQGEKENKKLTLTSKNETLLDMNSTKNGFEDHEEFRNIQEKINELTEQINLKLKQLQGKSSEPGQKKGLEGRALTEYENLKKRSGDIQNRKGLLKNKMNIDASKEKLKKLKKESTNYHNEIQKLEEGVKKSENDIVNQEKQIEQEYENQITQFEDAMQNIQEEKLGIHEKLNDLMIFYHESLEAKAMFKEDLNAKLLQRAELVAQREELDEIFAGLKLANKEETEYYENEDVIRQEVNSLAKYLNEIGFEKKRILPLFEAALEEIKELNNQLFDLEKRHQMAVAEKNQRLASDNIEIEEVENFINVRANELGLPELDELFEELCGVYSNHIEKEILSKQLMLIEDEEKKISEKFEGKEANLIEAIGLLRGRADDPTHALELQELHNKHEQLRIRHELRRNAIKKWKEEVRDVLAQKSEREASDQLNGIGYEKVFSQITTLLTQKEINEEEKKRFEELMLKYLRTVEQHEIYIHQKLQEEINMNEEKKLIEDRIEKKKIDKSKLDEKMRKLEEEYNKHLIHKKNMEQDLNEKKAIIEHHLLKEADNAFSAYLAQQSATFDTITRTYGPKAASSIKTDHHKEFIEITKANQQKRMERYKQVKNELNYMENSIKNNISSVDRNILPGLRSIDSSVKETQTFIQALKKEQIALLESEDEVSSQLSGIYQLRNNKLKMTKENYGYAAKQQIMKMKETKRILEKKVSLIDDEITKIENHLIEWDKAITQLTLEETKISREVNTYEQIYGPPTSSSSSDKETLEKEIKALKKQVDDLEVQKLLSEQRYIEQNFLSDEINRTSASYPTQDEGKSNESFHHEELTRVLNFKPEDSQEFTKKLKTEPVLHNERHVFVPHAIEISPIKQAFPNTPENIKGKRKRFDFSGNVPLPYPNLFDFQKSMEYSKLSSSATSLKQSSSKKNFKPNSRQTPGKEKEPTSYLKNHMRKSEHQKSSGQFVPGSLLNEYTQSHFNPTPLPVLSQSLNTRIMDHPSYIEPQRMSKLKLDAFDRGSLMNLPLQQIASYDSRVDTSMLSSSPKNVTLNLNNFMSSTSNSVNSSLVNSSGILPANYYAPKVNVNTSLLTIHEDQMSYRDALVRKSFGNNQSFTNDRQIESNFNPAVPKFISSKGPNPSRSSKNISLDTSLHENNAGNNSMLIDRNPEQDPEAMIFFRNYAVQDNMKLSKTKSNESLHKNTGSMASRINKLIPSVKEQMVRSRSVENHRGRHPRQATQTTYQTEESEGRVMTTTSIHNTSVGHSVDALRQRGHHRENSFGNRQKNIYKFKLDNCSLQDITFFEAIKPLLEGHYIFKKFANYQSLKKNAFDPLLADVFPAESCGFGMRNLKLHRNLEKIEVRHNQKPGVEATILINSIMRPIVPPITMDILKVQKRNHDYQNMTLLQDGKMDTTNPKAGPKGHVLEKCMSCTHYPFSILLDKGGRIELVAPNYQTFKEWINGLNCLMKFKKQLSKMRSKIETYCIQTEYSQIVNQIILLVDK